MHNLWSIYCETYNIFIIFSYNKKKGNFTYSYFFFFFLSGVSSSSAYTTIRTTKINKEKKDLTNKIKNHHSSCSGGKHTPDYWWRCARRHQCRSEVHSTRPESPAWPLAPTELHLHGPSSTEEKGFWGNRKEKELDMTEPRVLLALQRQNDFG